MGLELVKDGKSDSKIAQKERLEFGDWVFLHFTYGDKLFNLNNFP